MKPLNVLPKFENHFANQTVRFQVQLEAGGYFSAQKFSSLQPQQAGRVGTNSQFLNLILQIRLQKHLLGFAQTRYSAQNCADCASSLTLNKKIFSEKIRSRKIVVDSFNIVQKRKYHFLKNRAILWYALSRAFSKKRKHSFRFLLGILLKSTENRKECFLKISSWLWYAFYKPSSNLENRMTVCMGYTAMTLKWESRKTPPEGGRKSMQRERRTQYQLVKMAS